MQLPQLLTHRHLWVRKAASRLLGRAFADSGIGEHTLRTCLTSGVKLLKPEKDTLQACLTPGITLLKSAESMSR